MSDAAMVSYYHFSTISFEERYQMIQNLADVAEVVVQKEASYGNILRELKPEYMIHGDNWREGTLSNLRREVIDTLAEWNGTLIEVPYTYSEAVSKADKKDRKSVV